MNIMIVDDNQRMRAMLRSMVSTSDATIFEYTDGADAVAGFAQCGPHLVLMDIVMTNVDGITATREITSRYPASRIVIVSQYDDAELRKAASEAGAIGYVLKDRLEDLYQFLTVEGGSQ